MNNHINNTNNHNVSAHGVTITPAIQANIDSMINKLKTKFNNITNIHVNLKVDSVHPHLQHAEAEVHLSGKKETVVAKASSEDLYKSLHELKHKLDKQITKHKEIVQSHGNHNHLHHNYDFNNKNNN